MVYIFDRIMVDDEVCNGKPTIRGMRITAQTILEFLINGTSEEEILTQYPVLEQEDILAIKNFALALMDKNYQLYEIAA